MTIKYIQEQLGVVADGLWGNVSHTALIQALRQGKVIKASNNFTVNELLHSDKAVNNGIENLPSPQDFKNLINTVDNLWQLVRDLLGHPMKVTSAYRNPKVNKLVGSGSGSAHLVGYAIDFDCPSFGSTRQIASFLVNEFKDRGIAFDQIILEYPDSPSSWIHLGYKQPNTNKQRNQVLTAVKVNGITKYLSGLY